MEHGVRTLGDGIDNSLLYEKPKVEVAINEILINKSEYKSILKSLRPIETTCELINLVPKYIPRERKMPKYLIRKPKEPKFIPYEPYKAAVKPIVQSKEPTLYEVGQKKFSKNDIEIHELVNQMSEMRKIEMNKSNPAEEEHFETAQLKIQWQKEKQSYEVDIKNLRETNSLLENQLKFQAQVNSELKTLLVAAVGEDLESRVQHLTEDKLALARALLNSADHLTSHQEQTEWLSGQCEVWRSKFLASSVMVEELARWKSGLSNRLNELQEQTKTLLGERHKIHDLLLKTFNSLKSVLHKLNGKDLPTLKYGNVVEIASLNEEMVRKIKKCMKIDERVENDLNEKCMRPTVAEKAAEKLLQNPVTISNKQDVLCKAVMGAAATSVGNSQMFLQSPALHSCCSHCKGEIQNI